MTRNAATKGRPTSGKEKPQQKPRPDVKMPANLAPITGRTGPRPSY
jgi:hypothetical protein